VSLACEVVSDSGIEDEHRVTARNFDDSVKAAARPSSTGLRQRVRSVILLVMFAVFSAACAGPGVREEADYVFFPPSPETPRIQYLASYGTEWDVKGRLGGLAEFLYGEREPAKLLKPYGVAIHEGKIFVVDTIATGVAILDIANKKTETLGVKGQGILRKPINIAVDTDGTRYVTDRILERVMVYDAENQFVTSFGDPELWAPTDVVVSGEELLVADREAGQIFVLDKHTGEELRRLGSEGVGEAEFLFPTNLTVDQDGNIYVADTLNYRIQKIDPEGNPLMQIGEAGDGLGQFARPKGVAVDREGRLYAVDAAFMNVQIFNSEGQLLLVLGGGGFQPGEMYLPAKIKIDYDNVALFADRVASGHELEYLILVTNQYGPNKISVYGFLKQDIAE
jgi:DNA-binding beta-propeller fold protein YncE